MPPLKKETQRLAIDYLEEFQLIKIRKRPKNRKGIYVFTILNNAKLKTFAEHIFSEYQRTKESEYTPQNIDCGIHYDPETGNFFIGDELRGTLTSERRPKQLMDWIWKRFTDNNLREFFSKEVAHEFNWSQLKVQRAVYDIEDTLGFERGGLFRHIRGRNGWEFLENDLST